MNKYKFILFPLVFFILFIIVYYLKPKPFVKEIHYHAGFLVYIYGKKQDYSADKFMNPLACRLADAKLTPEEEQMEKAHLHDRVGDVVHVHRGGAVWRDLFKNIKFQFPLNKKILGYRNGKLVENILDQPIKSYDSIIIVIGSNKNINLSGYVSLAHIKEVESHTESCGK